MVGHAPLERIIGVRIPVGQQSSKVSKDLEGSDIILSMKNVFLGIVAILVLLVGVLWWSKSQQSKDPNVLVSHGLHWHPTLEIIVKGDKQTIPANIGMGPQYSSLPMGMSPIHTHDDISQNVIHMEFNGIVRKDDIKLRKFFEIWGRDIKSFGDNYTVTINGEPNTDPENYEMKDRDKIVINYQ